MKSAAFALPHQRLRPVTTHSSPSSTARVETPARSEPASGSDSAIAPIHSPRALRPSSSLRRSSSASAVPRPWERARMLAVDIQARASSSLTMQYSKTPSPRPPVLGRHGDAEVAELGQPRPAGTPGSRPSAGRARWRPAAPRPSRTGGPAAAAPPARACATGAAASGGFGCQVSGVSCRSTSSSVVSPRPGGMITYTLAGGGSPRTPPSSLRVTSAHWPSGRCAACPRTTWRHCEPAGSAREDLVQRHQLEVLRALVVLPVLGHEDARGERRPQGRCRDVDPVRVTRAVDAAAIGDPEASPRSCCRPRAGRRRRSCRPGSRRSDSPCRHARARS